jgi:hypothetical protein
MIIKSRKIIQTDKKAGIEEINANGIFVGRHVNKKHLGRP